MCLMTVRRNRVSRRLSSRSSANIAAGGTKSSLLPASELLAQRHPRRRVCRDAAEDRAGRRGRSGGECGIKGHWRLLTGFGLRGPLFSVQLFLCRFDHLVRLKAELSLKFLEWC